MSKRGGISSHHSISTVPVVKFYAHVLIQQLFAYTMHTDAIIAIIACIVFHALFEVDILEIETKELITS